MTVQDVHIEYATSDTTGSVTAGYVDLRGHLIPVQLRHVETEIRWPWYEAIMKPALPIETQQETSIYLYVHLDVACVDTGVDGGANLFYCMMVKTHILEDTTPCLSTLLLRLTDHHNGIFERIGIAQAPGLQQEKLDGLLVELKQQTSLPCRSSDEGMCTIRVV
jgi:hypothetical protein